MKKNLSLLLLAGIFFFGYSTKVSAASLPVVLFSDLTDGPVSGWEGSPTKGAAVSIWGRNLGSTRGSSFVTVGGVDLTSDSDYAEWGATTNPTVPLGMQRITFWLNSTMTTGGNFPNTTITITTANGISTSIPFHTRLLDTSSIYFLDSSKADDSGDGLSVATAKRTTAWARGNLKAGDIAYLKGGIYKDHDKGTAYHYGGLFSFGAPNGVANHENGIMEKRISVVAYPGELVQMEAVTPGEVTTDLKICINMFYAGSQLEYWTFSKFQMKAKQAAISLGGNGYTRGGTSNIRIVGIDATTVNSATTQWGNIFTLYGSTNGMTNLKLLGNYLHDQMSDVENHDKVAIKNYSSDLKRAYQVYVGGYGQIDDLEFGWNEFGWGGKGRGVQIYGHLPADSVDNLVFHDNWFHDDNRQCLVLGGGDGGSDYEFVKNAYVYNNIFSEPGSGWPTIVLGGISWGRQGGNFYVYNNIFSGDMVSMYPTIQMTGYHKKIELKNNIIVGTPNSYDYYTYYPDAANIDFSVVNASNNLYYGAGAGKKPNWDTSVLDNINPMFVSTSPQIWSDFTLLPDSPAINMGSSLVSALVVDDFNGISRPQDVGYDIGAFEYVNLIDPNDITPPSAPSGVSVN
jgi:hypothetical protein